MLENNLMYPPVSFTTESEQSLLTGIEASILLAPHTIHFPKVASAKSLLNDVTLLEVQLGLLGTVH